MAFEITTTGAYHIPSHVDLQVPQFTWCGWLRADSAGGSNLGAAISVNDHPGFIFWIQSDRGIRLRITTSSTWSIGYTATFGEWFHLAVTYDGTNARPYCDGVLKGTQARSTPNLASHHAIGKWETITSRNWNGAIDDYRFYDRALSGNELTAIYHQRGRDRVREGLLYRLLGADGASTGSAYTVIRDVAGASHDAGTKIGLGTTLLEGSPITHATGVRAA